MNEAVSLAPHISNEIEATNCVAGYLVGKVDTMGSLLWYFFSAFVGVCTCMLPHSLLAKSVGLKK